MDINNKNSSYIKTVNYSLLSLIVPRPAECIFLKLLLTKSALGFEVIPKEVWGNEVDSRYLEVSLFHF